MKGQNILRVLMQNTKLISKNIVSVVLAVCEATSCILPSADWEVLFFFILVNFSIFLIFY